MEEEQKIFVEGIKGPKVPSHCLMQQRLGLCFYRYESLDHYIK